MPEIRLLLLLCSLTVAWSSIAIPEKPARAQPVNADALVTASLLRPFEQPAPITVEYEEDTEINSRLVEVIAKDLRERGFTVVQGDAMLILRVSTGLPTFMERQRPSLGLEGRGGTGSRTTVTGNLRIPMDWEQQSRPVPHTRTEIAMLLRDANNVVLWSGRAEALPPGGDHYEKLSRMAPILLDRMGKSAANEIVPLP